MIANLGDMTPVVDLTHGKGTGPVRVQLQGVDALERRGTFWLRFMNCAPSPYGVASAGILAQAAVQCAGAPGVSRPPASTVIYSHNEKLCTLTRETVKTVVQRSFILLISRRLHTLDYSRAVGVSERVRPESRQAVAPPFNSPTAFDLLYRAPATDRPRRRE